MIQHSMKQNTADVKTFFDAWTDGGVYPHFSPHEYSEVLKISPSLQVPGKRVLDVGCGIGLVARAVHSLQHRVVGLDLSEKAIEEARKSGAIDEGVVADVSSTGFPDRSFDVILCWGVLFMVFDLPKIFAELHRILRPGGEILVFDHHRRNPYTWLHFHRPNWVDRVLEGRDNLPRRALDEKMIVSSGAGLFDFGRPVYFSVYTTHPNRTINAVHRIARRLFSWIRIWSRAPWTGNFVGIVGKKAG